VSRQERLAVLERGLDRHPAYLSWRSAVGNGRAPTSIELLKPEKRKSAVYRLRGLGHGSLPVVAKRCPPGTLAAEVRLYREVLPSIELPGLEIHAYVEEFDGFDWLFLEDAGETWYSRRSPEHRVLAVDWLARLHAGASPGVEWLQETGVEYFRSILDSAQEGLGRALQHAALSESDREVLMRILASLGRVEEEWHRVEDTCADMPSTLVHGDFVPKNVRVRRRGRRSELVVFDWETAGVALPAVDLAMLRSGEVHRRRYLAIVSDTWPGLRRRDLEKLEGAGALFRLLHEIYWENRSFAYAWVERAMRKMTGYEEQLRVLVAEGGWRT
jgi:thiamine kinase-like enzyme